VRNEGII